MNDEQIRYRLLRHSTEHETTTNSTVHRKLHKKLHACCHYCRWHRGENAGGRYRKHGLKKFTHLQDRRDGHNPREIHTESAA